MGFVSRLSERFMRCASWRGGGRTWYLCKLSGIEWECHQDCEDVRDGIKTLTWSAAFQSQTFLSVEVGLLEVWHPVDDCQLLVATYSTCT